MKECLNKMFASSEDLVVKDHRGRHSPKNKTPATQRKHEEDHINRFPACKSHYSRSHTLKKYLQCGSNVSKMYELYKNESNNPVSLRIYRQIFAKTGLEFKSPQLDTCHICDNFQAKLKYETESMIIDKLKELQKHHHDLEKAAYKSNKRDKEAAKVSNGTSVVAAFDFQQCLPTPQLNTSIAYYKRQLWTYNLTIHSTVGTTCCIWHGGIANRGSNGIASCLYSFLQRLESTVTHVILYSDSCAGQNKNSIVAAFLSTYKSS